MGNLAEGHTAGREQRLNRNKNQRLPEPGEGRLALMGVAAWGGLGDGGQYFCRFAKTTLVSLAERQKRNATNSTLRELHELMGK